MSAFKVSNYSVIPDLKRLHCSDSVVLEINVKLICSMPLTATVRGRYISEYEND